jgi:ABC-type spermidine/putrescine transport system permease subunit II
MRIADVLRRRRTILICAIVILYVGISVFPLAWMALASFSGDPYFRVLPTKYRAAAYAEVLSSSDPSLSFPSWYGNSVKVTISVTLLATALSALAGYSFSRFRFYGRQGLMYTILVGQMLPGVVLLLPLYIYLKDLRLLDTHLGLGIVYMTFAIPLCTWLLKGFFDTIPPDLEEAAMVDGCSRVGAMARIVLPLAAPDDPVRLHHGVERLHVRPGDPVHPGEVHHRSRLAGLSAGVLLPVEYPDGRWGSHVPPSARAVPVLTEISGDGAHARIGQGLSSSARGAERWR